MNEQTQTPVESGFEMVQTIVEYDENGNPIVPKRDEGTEVEGEVVKEVFVQPADTIN